MVVGCSESNPSSSSVCEDCVPQSCDQYDPLRVPLFGDTHIHTTYSFDANVRGTRLGHEAAYDFARGEPIGIQPYDEEGNSLRTIQRERPLDWVAISDHAEFFGTVVQCTDPTQPSYDHPQCELYRGGPLEAFANFGLLTSDPPETVSHPELCGEGGALCQEAGMEIWQKIQEDAEAFHDASSACEFSALLGYEWTPNPNTYNLHRNIIFKGDVVPDHAASYFDYHHVEDLWEHLRSECIDADTGCDALTIPHNSNLSDGRFFKPEDKNGDPIDAAYAEERAFMEPIFEIYQHKGDSECLPGEMISDELCGFEKLPYHNFASITVDFYTEPNPKDFLRSAYGQGMQHQRELGVNPFKHGIVASTDTHLAAPGHISEKAYAGHGNVGKGATATEFEVGLVDYPANSGGGLAAVWAEENSREAIFNAMRRKETYGTSGPQIVVRFFGGWSYPADMCDDVEFAELGYRRLRAMLGKAGDVEVVVECESAEAAQAFLERDDTVGVVFLDIQMPGSGGLSLARALRAGEPRTVIFVTAHAEHALEAFDVAAVDYLLKPFAQSRLEEALDRARAHAKRRSGSSELTQEFEHYPDRIPIPGRARVVFVDVPDIDRIEADGNYVVVHVGSQTHLLRSYLSEMEKTLDPKEFLRIHRSHMVRKTHIRELRTAPSGAHVVALTDGTVLPVGRTYLSEVLK